MKRENKDIFDMLNEVDIDLNNIEEISMNDIERKKLKKKLKKKNVKGNKKFKVGIIAASLAMAFIPASVEVISEMKDRFYYEQGLGIIEMDKNAGKLYRLNKPVVLNFGEEEYIIKNSSLSDGILKVNIWLGRQEFLKVGNEQNVYIKTEQGEKIKVDSISNYLYAAMDGGTLSNIELSFKVDKSMKSFKLISNDIESETNIELVEASTTADYKEATPYAQDGEIILGADVYEIKEKDHFTFWTNLDIDNENTQSDVEMYENIRVIGESGNELEVIPSNINWYTEYFVKSSEKIKSIEVNEIRVSNKLKEEEIVTVPIKIPEVGETLELDEKVKIVGIERAVDVTHVKNNNGILEIEMQSNYKDDKVGIEVLSADIAEGVTGYGDGRFNIEIRLDDVSEEEKKEKLLNLKIDTLSIKVRSKWKIDVK